MTRHGVTSLAGLRVAAYARFSSANQHETSIDDQVRRCRKFIEERGGTLNPELTFIDRATSGASLQRAGFEQLYTLAKAKQIDVIVTGDASRIFERAGRCRRAVSRAQVPGNPATGRG